jgi:hypothetical protein
MGDTIEDFRKMVAAIAEKNLKKAAEADKEWGEAALREAAARIAAMPKREFRKRLEFLATKLLGNEYRAVRDEMRRREADKKSP